MSAPSNSPPDDERQRLAAIIDCTGAGTWEWNIQTGETRFNERWAGIVGMTLAELQPVSLKTWEALAHPDDVLRSLAVLERHLAGETETYECEARMRHRAGHWVWVMARGRLLTRTPDGQPEWMFGTHLDISEQVAQKESLRKSLQLLSRAGDMAELGGWELDLATQVITWSEQTRRIHGLAPDDNPQPTETLDFYAPEARPTIRAAVARAIKDGVGWDLELPFIQAGGRPIWVRVVGSVESEDGKPVRLLGTLQDVTQRVLQRQALERAHERMAVATRSGGVGIWDWDLKAEVLSWDAQMYALYGWPEGVATDPHQLWADQLHPEDSVAARQAVREALVSAVEFDIEFRIIRADGSVRHLRSTARIHRNSQGRARRMVGVNWDVTATRELSAALAAQHELLRVTLQSIGDAVITTDAQSRVTWLNPVAERMTGWLNSEALGRPLGQVFRSVDEDSREPSDNPVAACLQGAAAVSQAGHAVLVSRDGQEFGIEHSAAPIRGGMTQGMADMLGVVLVFRDVTEQRRLSGEMRYRATHDVLTGLVNRAEFESRLQRTLNKAHEDGSSHALLYIDLDQFKLVNDACGQVVGDRLLQQMAKLLRDTVRARDTLARLGGDEFAVILEHCGGDQARRVAQQLCDQMEGFRFVHDGRRFRIGTSIGLVPVDHRWTSIKPLIQAADTACYAAKEAGRNRVHTWFDTDQAMRNRHGEMQWAARLEQALDDERFVLHAQRLTPLGEHAVAGLHAEVLVRLPDEDGSLIPPRAFLPAAERFHLATRIDRWVLHRATAWLAALPEITRVNTLCVNLSGPSVGDRAFHRQAIDALAAAGSAVCQRLCLEITETSAVGQMADAALFIEQVRTLGVRIALDDFGAGASSFGYLKTLTVDLLKIDGQFIKDLPNDPLDDAAVRCFVDVARIVGVQTVAEFVDRPEVLERVKALGIDYAQGFLLHQPVPLDRVFEPAVC